MEEPMTNQNKILEEKVRRQLKEPSENAVAWNMKHYICDVMLQAENGKQEARSGGEREDLQEAKEDQEAAEKETEKEKTVSFDKKG